MPKLLKFAKWRPETRQVWVMIWRIALIHFVVEALIMGTLSGWSLTSQVVLTGLLDCSLLTLLSTPPIYSWVAKPFIMSARNAEQALNRELDAKAVQAANLEATLGNLRHLLDQNEDLKQRLQQSHARGADINEQTLQRIGADLHDGPAQLLAYSLLRLDSFAPAVATAKGGRGAEELETMRVALTDTLTELRNISRGLSLPQLASATLEETIEFAVTQHQEQTGTTVDMEIRQLPNMAPQAIKTCVYRVVQESLANATKHAKAVQQRLFAELDTHLSLTISDAGPGFDPDATGGRGLGLNGMRSRVEALGGSVTINSSAGRGTAVIVRLPMVEAPPIGLVHRSAQSSNGASLAQ